jgi:hypothetical protein
MKTMRILGLAMFAYGAIMLILLLTPARQWALDHSIAAAVSTVDRRAGNGIQGSADLPMAIAGSAVVMLAGLWFGILVPYVIGRNAARQRAIIEQDLAP